MNEDRIKQAIDTRLSRLKFKPELVGEKPRLKTSYRRKTWSAAIAAVLCLALLAGVTASLLPGIQQTALSNAEPSTKVQTVSESDGLKVELIKAYYDDSYKLTIELKITAQNGVSLNDRSMFWGESLQAITSSSGKRLEIKSFSTNTSYDETTGELQFTVQTKEWAPDLGQKVVFTLSDYSDRISNKPQWNMGMTLQEILSREPDFQEIEPEKLPIDPERTQALLKDQGKIIMLARDQWVAHNEKIGSTYLSNVGVVDGILHVQIHSPDDYMCQQIFPFYFVNSQGEQFPLVDYSVPLGVNSSASATFTLEENGVTQEMLFEMDEQAIADLRENNHGRIDDLELVGVMNINTTDMMTAGPWEIVVEPEDRRGARD